MNSPAEFHNTICLHGPHRPVASWVEGDPGFAYVQTSGASILIHTYNEAVLLIDAIAEARDLLHEGGAS